MPIPGFDTPPIGHVEPLLFGLALSADAYAGADAATLQDDGFDIGDARLSLRGELQKGWGYFIQTDVVSSPALLDLEVKWSSEEVGFLIKAGYFRVPVSGELQIAAPYLDLIERSQIVNSVAPDRQVGIEIDQQIVGSALVVRAGLFNGNGLDTNDNNRFLYALRLEGNIPLAIETETDGWFLEYGISGAYSKDRDADLGGELPNPFRGTRAMGGADMRLNMQSVFVSVEGLYASLDRFDLSRRNVFGYQATVGWNATNSIQLLARYDSFWGGSLASDLDLAIASIVIAFIPHITLQTELRVPTRGASPTPGAIASLTVLF